MQLKKEHLLRRLGVRISGLSVLSINFVSKILFFYFAVITSFLIKIFQLILRGHERAVECVSVNSDSTRAISGSVDTNLKIWNLDASDEATTYEKEEEEESAKKRRKKETKTKVPMVTIGGHRDKVSAVEWCPWNSGHAFSCSWDHTIVEWDLELG